MNALAMYKWHQMFKMQVAPPQVTDGLFMMAIKVIAPDGFNES